MNLRITKLLLLSILLTACGAKNGEAPALTAASPAAPELLNRTAAVDQSGFSRKINFKNLKLRRLESGCLKLRSQ